MAVIKQSTSRYVHSKLDLNQCDLVVCYICFTIAAKLNLICTKKRKSIGAFLDIGDSCRTYLGCLYYCVFVPYFAYCMG